MLYKIVIYYFIDIVYTNVANGNVHVPEIQQELEEQCIADMIASKSLFNSDIAIINNDIVTTELLRKIHETNNVKLYVKDGGVRVAASPTIFIIFGQNLSYFQNLIDVMNKDNYRKPEAIYIIMIADTTKDNIILVFHTLWKYHIIHTLIIVRETNNYSSIFSYFPYAEGGCGRNYSNTVKISDCNRVKTSDIMDSIHEHDIPILKNCVLQVATHNYPPLVMSDKDSKNEYAVGIEIFFLNILAQTENISLNYIFLSETEFGQVFDNFTVTGILRKLHENEVDLIIGAFALNSRRALFFDFIWTHFAYEDSFVIVTPSSGLLERWKIIYKVFTPLVWLLLLIIFLLCSFLLSNNKDYYTVLNKYISSELLNLFGNCTHNIKLSLKRQTFKNLIIVHWIWFGFLVNCFYQTKLTSFTTYRTSKSQLNEYISLYDFNITPCFAPDIASFMKSSGQVPIIHEEYLETLGCETADLSMDMVAKTQNKYTVTHYYRYLWWITRNPTKKAQIHVMKEKLYNTLYAIFLKRGFPLLKDFQLKILRLVDNGFVDVAKKIHMFDNDVDSNVGGSFEISSLKLVDFIIPFSILSTGLVLAFVIFIIELMYAD
ncbi:uncharacterized protein LOC133520846 [Cydia pomonella]|uniref:uncharacterized protein LOC133520846 n=1 Tax=Cydia pomonella TaxID=82600 RepID=UPI002ADE0E49|nr:uncharacterized protein LOC133520846 [Cydia pomonella]